MSPTLKKIVFLICLVGFAQPVLSRIADPTKESMTRKLGMGPAPISEEFPYQAVGTDLKCPFGASDGRMFKNTDTATVEECYDRCYGLESCNFFTYQASSNMCIGCTLEGADKLVDGPGLDSYEMTTIKSSSDFGYELWNGVQGIGMKCPHQHQDRITKLADTTKDECFQACVDNDECRWFSWGEDEVTQSQWKGNCMLCREDDELQAHEGFNFWRVLETPGCAGDVQLLKHDGVSQCETVTIVSQDVTNVTVSVTHDCTKSETDTYVDSIFAQFQQSTFSTKCLEDDKFYADESVEFTITCRSTTHHALLELWVADDSSKGFLVAGDNATVPECCHPSQQITTYRSVYSIACAPTC